MIFKQWKHVVWAVSFLFIFLIPLAIFGFGVLISMAWNLTKIFFE